MILINLLPPEFQQAVKKPPLGLDPRVIKIAGGLFVVLTVFLYVQYLLEVNTVKKLRTQWDSMQQEVATAEQLQVEMEGGVKAERNFLEQYIASPFSAATALNAISQHLPNSIWLVELKIDRQIKGSSLLVKGVALPLGAQSSVEIIEKYLRDLKGSFPENTDLVLTTSRQQKEKRELTFFTAIFHWL